MEHVEITIEDDRDEKDKPPIDADKIDLEAVVDAVASLCDGVTLAGTAEKPLKLEVSVKAVPTTPDGKKKAPTAFAHPQPKDAFEAEEVTHYVQEDGEWVEKKTTLTFKVQQPDFDAWHVHLALIPRDELSFGTIRAVSRGLSREVHKIAMIRQYGEVLGAMMTDKEFDAAGTKFADDAPWALG